MTNDIQAVNSGDSWTNSEVTYTFGSTNGNISSSTDGVTNVKLFNSDQQTATNKILQLIENYTNLTITQTSETADITFRAGNLESGVAGFAYTPSDLLGSDVFIDNDYDSTNVTTNEEYYSLEEGNFGFLLLLHEIGHAFGLSHPHTGSTTLSTADDTLNASVLSYNGSTSSSTGGLTATQIGPSAPATYQIYDIAILQELYGVNSSYNSGDTTYTLDGNTTVFTIWDGAGTDKLDASSYDNNAVIDLREGLENVTTVGNTNIFLAFNANIEDADGGSGNDIITGNALNNNLRGLAGNDSIDGASGNDTFNGNAGIDTLDGGAGEDLIRGGKDQDYITGGSGNDFINGNNDNDTLFGNGGDDTIHGGKSDDSISGNGGDDLIFGDLGNDTLTGSVGNDIFVFKSDGGNDIITDFTIGSDTIELRSTSFDSSSILSVISIEGNDTHIAIAEGTELILSGTTGISADDFSFV